MIKTAIFEQDTATMLSKARLVQNYADAIHIDIADGRLVDGETFTDMKILAELQTNSEIEIHLMVRDPAFYVQMCPKNVQTLISQVEIDNIPGFIIACKAKGLYPALSIKPETDYQLVVPYLDDIKFVQFMSVEPGGQARNFHTEVLGQIKKFKEEYPTVVLQIDGAMYFQRIQDIEKNINIEHYVVGSDIFKSNDPVAELKQLEEIIY